MGAFVLLSLKDDSLRNATSKVCDTVHVLMGSMHQSL